MGKASLFVISGPSGAGKGTLVSRYMGEHPDAYLSVSATTRKPRQGEVDGVSYHFMTVDEFERTIADDGFIEWAKVHSNYYGTPIEPIEKHLACGDDVLLEIDVQGAFQVKRIFDDAKLIFIAPPSMEELASRLKGRGTESQAVIEQRMKNAEAEMDAAKEYDFVIVNDDLDEATKEFADVIESCVQS